MMKDRFDPHEWEMLKTLPLRMLFIATTYTQVAGGDIQNVIKSFTERLLSGATEYRDPLHRELAVDIVRSDLAALMRTAFDGNHAIEKLTEIKALLRDNLTRDEYDRFIGSLFIELGMETATAVFSARKGVWPFNKRKGTRDKVIANESQAINFAAAFWEVNLDAVRRLAGTS